MEKRVLLAVVLSFIVLYGYQAMFPPPPPPAFETAPPPATPGEPTSEATHAPAPQPQPQPTPQLEVAEPTVGSAAEQDIVLDSPAVHAVFSNRGAVLKSWRLKNYRDSSGQPLDLVPPAIAGAARPFTLGSPDQDAAAVLRSALFKPSAERVTVGPEGAMLAFEYSDASGLTARKEFSFTVDQPFVIGFTADVQRNGAPVETTVQWGPAIGTGVVPGGLTYAPPSQPIFYKDGEVTRLAIDDLQEQSVFEGLFKFAGVDDHYFLSAVVSELPLRIEYQPHQIPVQDSDRGLQFVDWTVRFASPPRNVQYFFGPKDFDHLKAVGPDLTHAIHFGIFRWLVVPLMNALKWVDGYLGNYGWSIIALTVLINLVMFPLRHKSVVSMRRMQELQPEVKAIQERYAKLKMSDPARQKMNAELMTLYRERGVNPASGCVPMLLTLPVLFAFYSMLSVAIELRGAPFVAWVKDLSAHDPFFVLPVLMGLTMVAQQKMTPATADPMQQRMMMFMPLVLTGTMLWAPAGLMLYWTASNLWGIGQQAVTNRLIGAPPVHTVRPPAERRLKNAGTGKSPRAAKERK
jgi:YidC/Oxa1 family membrane protein insertase